MDIKVFLRCGCVDEQEGKHTIFSETEPDVPVAERVYVQFKYSWETFIDGIRHGNPPPLILR